MSKSKKRAAPEWCRPILHDDKIYFNPWCEEGIVHVIAATPERKSALESTALDRHQFGDLIAKANILKKYTNIYQVEVDPHKERDKSHDYIVELKIDDSKLIVTTELSETYSVDL
jgi:hypothetical protein